MFRPWVRESSGQAYEMRKWVSRSEKTEPGIVRRFCLIARSTNWVAVSSVGTLGNA